MSRILDAKKLVAAISVVFLMATLGVIQATVSNAASLKPGVCTWKIDKSTAIAKYVAADREAVSLLPTSTENNEFYSCVQVVGNFNSCRFAAPDAFSVLTFNNSAKDYNNRSLNYICHTKEIAQSPVKQREFSLKHLVTDKTIIEHAVAKKSINDEWPEFLRFGIPSQPVTTPLASVSSTTDETDSSGNCERKAVTNPTYNGTKLKTYLCDFVNGTTTGFKSQNGYAKLNAAQSKYNNAKRQVDTAKAVLAGRDTAVRKAEEAFDKSASSIAEGNLEKAYRNQAAAKAELNKANSAFTQAKSELDSANKNIAGYKKSSDSNWVTCKRAVGSDTMVMTKAMVKKNGSEKNQRWAWVSSKSIKGGSESLKVLPPCPSSIPPNFS